MVFQATVLLQLVPAPRGQGAVHCPLVAPQGPVLGGHPMKSLATAVLEEVVSAWMEQALIVLTVQGQGLTLLMVHLSAAHRQLTWQAWWQEETGTAHVLLALRVEL